MKTSGSCSKTTPREPGSTDFSIASQMGGWSAHQAAESISIIGAKIAEATRSWLADRDRNPERSMSSLRLEVREDIPSSHLLVVSRTQRGEIIDLKVVGLEPSPPSQTTSSETCGNCAGSSTNLT
jgi:hypothetical protein